MAQAKAMVVAMADSQVGYASGSGQYGMYSKGGNWVTKWNGRRTYWCAIGASWCFDQCFGAKAARAGIGWQNSNRDWPPVGWSATWLWRDWFRNRNLWVGMANAQPGDISLQSWGRTGNSTDHVEIVRAKGSRSSTPTIGFNTATGNATAGAGVQRATRYSNITVGIYRPDWNALVRAYNADIKDAAPKPKPINYPIALSHLGYARGANGVRNYQKDRGLTVDGIPGKNTKAALEADMATIKQVLAEVKKVGTVNVSKGTADLLHTSRSGPQPLQFIVDLAARRIGRTEDYVLDLRSEVAGLNEAIMQIGESQGMNRAQVEKITKETVNKARVSMTVPEDD